MVECGKCDYVGDFKEFKKATQEDLFNNYNDGRYETLEEIDIEEITKDTIELSCFYYTCPNCGESIYNEDGQIKYINENGGRL